MRRREVLALLASAMASWPLTAIGQSVGRVRNIGVLMGLAESDPEVLRRIAILRQALRDLGWIEGLNIRIHYRSAIEGHRRRALGEELIALPADVIIAASSIVTTTLLQETRTIPVVFVTASDPIGDGFVASLAQPNRNATGFTSNPSSFCSKWLELLQEIAPGTTHFTAMCHPDSSPAGGTYFLPPFPAAAASMSVDLDVALLHEPTDIERVLPPRSPPLRPLSLPSQF